MTRFASLKVNIIISTIAKSISITDLFSEALSHLKEIVRISPVYEIETFRATMDSGKNS